MQAIELDRSEVEEHGNVITHGIGAVAALIGTVALVWVTLGRGDPWRVFSCSVYGLSLLAVFVSSTLYHSARRPMWRWRMLMFDYTAIYLLIAGSYTPWALVTLRETSGWWLFGMMWTFAAIGIALRFWGPRDWPLLTTGLYVLMGWSGALLALPMLSALPLPALAWLLAGGVAYSVGAVFFLWRMLPFNHLIWHFAVLIGAGCHFVSVWSWVALS